MVVPVDVERVTNVTRGLDVVAVECCDVLVDLSTLDVTCTRPDRPAPPRTFARDVGLFVVLDGDIMEALGSLVTPGDGATAPRTTGVVFVVSAEVTAAAVVITGGDPLVDWVTATLTVPSNTLGLAGADCGVVVPETGRLQTREPGAVSVSDIPVVGVAAVLRERPPPPARLARLRLAERRTAFARDSTPPWIGLHRTGRRRCRVGFDCRRRVARANVDAAQWKVWARTQWRKLAINAKLLATLCLELIAAGFRKRRLDQAGQEERNFILAKTSENRR